MNFTQPPIERSGRVFVPLRGVFEQLGASVVYSNGQINATGNGRTISLTIGSTQATVAGQPTLMDVAPFIVGATTYVPLRFISQALGASVNWDNSTSTVTINGRAGAGAGTADATATGTTRAGATSQQAGAFGIGVSDRNDLYLHAGHSFSVRPGGAVEPVSDLNRRS
jgi:hypothetical protein